MRRLRVIVAGGYPVVRSGIRHVLEVEGDIDVVTEAGDGEEAQRLALDLTPDVLLLDGRMLECGGLEVVARLREALPEIHLMVVVDDGLQLGAMRAIGLGVEGYLLKSLAVHRVAEAVRSVCAGRLFIEAEADSVLPRSSGMPGRELPTRRELEVLLLLAAGCRNREIASKLCITERTVQFHVSNLIGKFGVRSRAELAGMARR